MDRGLYTAASTMHVQQGVLDTTAVNIANVDTTGFRRTMPVARGFQLVFGAEIGRSPSRAPSPVAGGGAQVDATYMDVQQGPLRHTGRALDVALDGPGFFVLETPAGFRYTRAGNFQLNERGELVTAGGDLVAGLAGPIVIRGGEVEIDPQGTVLVDGAAVDRLHVVEFADPQALQREGGSRFRAPVAEERQAVDATGTAVRQHHLEGPNFNAVDELVRMITAQRGFELAARNIRVIDRTLGAAVEDIARAV